MTSTDSARLALRTATAAQHDRVDGVFSNATLAESEGYGRFLLAQAAALFAVEQALDDAGVGRIVPDWPERRRGALLRSDIAALGLTPPAPAAAMTFAGDAAMLGGLYVLEGSRLGGTLLKRSVPPDFPTAFLAGGNSLRWRRLLSIIDARLHAANDLDAAIAAAKDVLALFEQSGRLFLRAS